MRDIATLKEQVGFAERHLKTAETARNRESETLMETWRKIRERFNHQEGEIARHRAEVEALIENNESLSRMVDDLIATIGGNVERARDETVPKITTLAEEMLASEPSEDDFARFAADADADAEDDGPAPDGDAAEPASPDDDILDLDIEAIDAIDAIDKIDTIGPSNTADLDIPSSEAPDDDGGSFEEVSAESLSPGIRNLIQRVEGSVGDAGELSPDPEDDFDEDDELARELKEIELLRSELSGLRDRITADDA